MKALRYLLMVVAMVSFLSVRAQGLAQQPNTEMHSTSVMVGAGSTLPQAAIDGVTTTTGQQAQAGRPGHVRKGWGGEGEPGDRPEPWETPIDDAIWFLLFLACAHLIYAFVRARAKVKE